MTTKNNKQIARRVLEDLFTKGNLALAEELYAPNYVHHDPASPEFGGGPEGMRQLVTMYRTAFPDLSMTVEDQIADADTVVTRWTASGTQQAELMGIPPTGKHATVSGISMEHIRDGKIVEAWITWDALRLMQQLGVVPAPEQADAYFEDDH